METTLPSLSSEELENLAEKCLSNLSPEGRLTVLGKVGITGEKLKSMEGARDYFMAYDYDTHARTVVKFDKEEFPSNSATLVRDGTIEVLEVLKDKQSFLSDPHLDEIIKMKIKGIKEIVHLHYACHRTKHTCMEAVALRIGDKKCTFECGDYSRHRIGDDGIYVLKTLHKALGIPKEQTAKMISLLFSSNNVYMVMSLRLKIGGTEDYM